MRVCLHDIGRVQISIESSKDFMKTPFYIVNHIKGRPPYETKSAQVLANEVKLLTPRCKYGKNQVCQK